jgi:hypothetical protein
METSEKSQRNHEDFIPGGKQNFINNVVPYVWYGYFQTFLKLFVILSRKNLAYLTVDQLSSLS